MTKFRIKLAHNKELIEYSALSMKDAINYVEKNYCAKVISCEDVSENISITLKEYQDLCYARDFLLALGEAGVYDWEGYDQAAKKFYKQG
jgi:chromosome condensin MukBEF complex kleisin-like MukF subunit